jgi:penicillin-binding protein 1B
MTKRRTLSKKPVRKTKRGKKQFSFKRWLFKWIAFPAILVAAGWVLWTDYQIRNSFGQLQWELPARIYAKAHELYPGMSLPPERLRTTLVDLGYRQTDVPNNPGEFRQLGNQFELYTRGFQFWDGPEPERLVNLQYSGGSISRLTDSRGDPVPLMRLEPLEIAQINPETGQDRLPMSLEDVPQQLIDAVVAIEDRRFYSHIGVDFLGIARAMVANIRAGGIVQGGSTLTQQLVKNLYLHRDQTLARKAEEAVMALALEVHFTKDQILEGYMNEVFLGQQGNRAIHGFSLASEFYFGRRLDQLSLPEFALLAGMPQAPSLYNPRRNPERAIERRNTVLAQMAAQGLITERERELATRASLDVIERPRSRSNAYPAFMALVRDNLAREYDIESLRRSGLRIFTTLDVGIQEEVEQHLQEAVDAVEIDSATADKLQAATIITDASTGEVRAISGGRDPDDRGFNRALNARRQIGSLIKPFVYLAALDSGRFSLASILDDRPVEIELDNGDIWSPANYNRQYDGNVYLYEALYRSLNLATVDLGMELGVSRVLRMLEKAGYQGDANPYPSLLLGAVEMSPLEVAQIYQSLTSGGYYSPLRAVVAVTSGEGQPLQRYGVESTPITDPQSMFLLEHAMQSVFYRGTAQSAKRVLGNQLPLAGKTGTTNDLRDSWFVGYGSNLMGVVWLGHDENVDTGLSGSTGALPVWTDLMTRLDIQPRFTTAPEGIVWHRVAPVPTQTRSSQDCSQAESLPFAASVLPQASVDCEANGSIFDRFFGQVRSITP